ncbi:hypothetical protein NPIL_526251 [Nephila pilipes]|uniref:Uncharacterized protein n=1 Tax=Nephila pilipes TaxID=299642 RepID=A0A8X6U9N5_NEPPI|nr:hypothetical protein NPIL_526251 [Nephila pilipes]
MGKQLVKQKKDSKIGTFYFNEGMTRLIKREDVLSLTPGDNTIAWCETEVKCLPTSLTNGLKVKIYDIRVFGDTKGNSNFHTAGQNSPSLENQKRRNVITTTRVRMELGKEIHSWKGKKAPCSCRDQKNSEGFSKGQL